jgi:hypothetical protein
MGINSVAVVGPRSEPVEQKREKKDPLDQILQGLQIANGALGIGVNLTTIQKHMAEKQAMQEAREGFISKDRVMKAQEQGLTPVDANTPGAIKYKVGNPDSFEEKAFILQNQKGEKMPLLETIKTYGADGKSPVFKTIEKVPGQEYPAFVEPKAAPEPKKPDVVPVETVDEQGNPIVKFVEKTPGQTFAKPKPQPGPNAKPPADAPYPDRVRALSTDDKRRFDSVSMGIGAVEDMRKAYEAGDNTFSVVGDNSFTAASSRFEEALGRMQSGGAIGKEEAASFRKMRPMPTDPVEIQKQKLDYLYTEMASRVQTMGFSPDEVLKARSDLAAQTPKTKDPGTSGQAQAGTPQVSPQDKQALEWLKANPTSPDAPGVEAALKAKGLL